MAKTKQTDITMLMKLSAFVVLLLGIWVGNFYKSKYRIFYGLGVIIIAYLMFIVALLYDIIDKIN